MGPKATVHDEWRFKDFVPQSNGPIDYLSLDGETAIEVKGDVQGSRSLYAAVMQLALYLERNGKVRRACLVLIQDRMSLQRIKDEWHAMKQVLRSETAGNLGIVVLAHDTSWIEPEEKSFRKIADDFEIALRRQKNLQGQTLPQPAGQKLYEVFKVLLSRWLQLRPPIAIGELAQTAGCSYPTVQKALDKLRNVLQFSSNRSVELKAFPHDTWRELVALSGTLRNSLRFEDQSGDPPMPLSLLKRLEQLKTSNLALGGALAARHWHPDFDLHGTPRLDLVYHAPNGRIDLDFVRQLDPALTEVTDPAAPAALVIHPLIRASSLFSERDGKSVMWSDPVETALDLCDLSLTAQANQLLTYLRPEVRLT